MRLSAEINSQVKETHIQASVLILISKLTLWLSLTLVIYYFLFADIAGQLSALFSNSMRTFNFQFLPWIVLAVGLTALWLTRKSVWQAMQAENRDGKTAVLGFVRRFLGLDLILATFLLLLAYPLPPSQELLIFRLLTAVLAGFVLVFGRRAALVPSTVIAVYGISILSVSGMSAFLA
jgi:hypothetical protein